MPVLREVGFAGDVLRPDQVDRREAWRGATTRTREPRSWTTDELVELERLGFAIESHGHAHIDYARSEPAVVERRCCGVSVESTRHDPRSRTALSRVSVRPGNARPRRARLRGCGLRAGVRARPPAGHLRALRAGARPDRPGGREAALRAQDGRPVQRVAAQRPGAWRHIGPSDPSSATGGCGPSPLAPDAVDRPADCPMDARAAQRMPDRGPGPNGDGRHGARADAALQELVRAGREPQLVGRLALAEIDLADPERGRGTRPARARA